MTAGAAEYGRQRRQNVNSKKQEQLEQMRLAAQDDFRELDSALQQMLEKVAVNARPEPSEVQAAADLLQANKRNAQVLDEKQKAQFMLLQAWTGYFQGNDAIAINWSTKACKTDTDNGDAWISQGLFSMLKSKPPLQPKPPKPERKQRTLNYSYGYGNRRQERETEPVEEKEDLASLYGQSKSLQFDMSTIHKTMFREKIARFEYIAVNGTALEFKPGRDTLCALFWQSEEPLEDPNNLSPEEAAQVRRKMKEKEQNKEKFVVPEELTIEKQRKYYTSLYEACKQDETIKFLQINTTMPKNLDGFMRSLPGYHDVAYPTIVAAAPASNARPIAGTDARIPFMLIADKKGDVKYAGPAKDFLPAFILTETTGVPIDLKDQIKPAKKQHYDDMMMDPMLMEMQMMEMQTPQPKPTPKADPNKPVIDPNAILQMLPKTSPQGKTYRQLPLEESYQAGKDLEYANMFIDAARKRAQTYKKGVEQCRKIIKNYPDTLFEQQARELLRKVPEHKRATYGITDEELGL